jgi:hypothetical protein
VDEQGGEEEHRRDRKRNNSAPDCKRTVHAARVRATPV